MSPSSIPRILRGRGPWLAAALTLSAWLTAMPGRCTLAPHAAPAAASTHTHFSWPWLQALWAWLPPGAAFGQALHAAHAPQQGSSRWHLPAGAGAAADDAGDGNGSACNTDPNGHCPGP